MQKKYIEQHLANVDDVFWRRAEGFARGFMEFIGKAGMTVEDSTDAYLKMCNNMLVEQIKFMRTGRYTCRSAEEARVRVYTSENEMASYMIGVALSQFLWPNHYGLYDFFITESRKIARVECYLEIGPGHGLFLVESMRHFPDAEFLAVDISPVSRNLSEAMARHFVPDVGCTFEVNDARLLNRNTYDYVVMCEVLEHLDEPKEMMVKARELLSDHGHFFVSTCANCPAIDHVYLYESVVQIRQEIEDVGFQIVSELSLPVYKNRKMPWSENKMEVNYAAMLRKR